MNKILFSIEFIFLFVFIDFNTANKSKPGSLKQLPTEIYPKDWNITFNLFLPNEPQKQIIIDFNANDTEILNSGFNSKLKTKFIIHGWSSGFYKLDMFDRPWMKDVKDYILDQFQYNVICVDWEKPASNVEYGRVIPNASIVGSMVANFINKLINLMNASTVDMHCIGHSLGAHICGFAARALKPNRLARITGLDPAGLAFRGLTPDTTPLDSSDANLVLVLHTSAGLKSPAGFNLAGFIGHAGSLGHYDFRINGGNVQPTCNQINRVFGSLAKLPFLFNLNQYFSDVETALFCPHDMAYKYPIARPSNGCQFIAYNCTDYKEFEDGKCAKEGIPLEFDFNYYDDLDFKPNELELPNNLYIKTSDSYPYCLFHYQIVIEYQSQSLITETIKLQVLGEKQIELKITIYPKVKENVLYLLYTDSEELGTVTEIRYHNTRITLKQITINYMSHVDQKIREMKSSKPVVIDETNLFGPQIPFWTDLISKSLK